MSIGQYERLFHFTMYSEISDFADSSVILVFTTTVLAVDSSLPFAFSHAS